MAGNPVSKRIPELDGLRGAAIAMVVVLHYFYYSPAASHRPSDLIRSAYVHFERFIALGWTGVDLFFILSGFLIGGILLDARSSPNYFKTFYIRRFYRIIPLYYAWIVVFVFALIFAGRFFNGYASEVGDGGSSSHLYLLLIFLQNCGMVGYSTFAKAFFGTTWSLCVEEQFYLLAPLVIRLISKRWLYGFLSVVICAAPLLRLWVRYHIPAQGFEPAYELMACRSDALAVGILMALVWRNNLFRSWLSANGAVLSGVFGVFLLGVLALWKYSPVYNSYAMQSIGYTWIACFYAVVLLMALSQPSGIVARVARLSWLRELGRVSYCLYIVHTGVAFTCQAVVRASLGHLDSWQKPLVNVIAAVIAYLIARVSWTYFEHPLVRRGHETTYLLAEGEASRRDGRTSGSKGRKELTVVPEEV